MRKLKVDFNVLSSYLADNGNRSVVDVYKELKRKKLKQLSNEEILVLSYLKLNKRKLGLK